MTKEEFLELATDNYQGRGSNYPKSGIPDSIEILNNYMHHENVYFLMVTFNNTDEKTAESWLNEFVKKHKLISLWNSASAHQHGNYKDEWVTASIPICM